MTLSSPFIRFANKRFHCVKQTLLWATANFEAILIPTSFANVSLPVFIRQIKNALLKIMRFLLNQKVKPRELFLPSR